MNTTYEEIYELFFNRIINDRRFWISTVTPDEMLAIAKKRAKPLIGQAVSNITLATKYDMPVGDNNETIDIIGNMDDDLELFLITLTRIEKELIANVMMYEYLKGDIVTRLNALGTIFGDSELKVFAPSNEVDAFNDSLEKLAIENNEAIISYKLRNRKTNKRKRYKFENNGV